MSVSKEPLSVRNNNPGNLRYVGQEGASPGEGGFARFETPEAGMEAMRRQIELDTQTRGMNLGQFLNKYAPPSENKTGNYIQFVSQKTGLDPNQPVPAEKIAAIQAAMIEMEGGPRSVAAFKVASAPTPARPVAQGPRTTRPAEYTQVASASTGAKPSLTELPPSYRAALAANYIADTEDPEVSIADKAVALLEEMQSGGGPRGAATFNKMMGQEEAVNPFALMAKAQEPEAQPRRRVVPRMPQRFSKGGDVSNEVPRVDAQGKVIRDAPVPERPLSVGEQVVGAGEAALSLASGLTAPASIAYDVLRGVPRQEISPSRFMYTPRTEGGQRAAEGLGRFMQEYKLDVATPQVQLQRPYPVRAAAKQGIEALREGVEGTSTAAVRAITGKPNITTEQIYQAMGEPKGILQLGAPAATRPGGSLMYGDEVSQNLIKLAQENETPSRDAIVEFAPKIAKYMERQYSAPNDPLFTAAIEGRFKPKSFYRPNSIFSDYAKPIAKLTDKPLRENNTLTIEHIDELLRLSREGNEKAREIVARGVDRSMLTEGRVTTEQIVNELKNADVFNNTLKGLERYTEIGVGNEFKGKENVLPSLTAFVRQKGVPMDDAQKEIFSTIKFRIAREAERKAEGIVSQQAKDPLQTRYPMSVTPLMEHEVAKFERSMTPAMQEELSRGKPVYMFGGPYGNAFDVEDVFEYMSETDPKKWSKMSAPELIIAASSKNPSTVTSPTRIARMADDGYQLTPDQARVGTQSFMPVESPTLGKGSEWREITDKYGLRIEGGIMQHCLKRDASGYCNRLLNEESKYFSLRDADGQPYVSIEISKPIGQEKDNVPFSVIRQIKGHSNQPAVPLYGEEITTFLTDWQKKIGVPLRVSESPDYVPSDFKPKQFGMEAPPEGFAKGGMVDKPLYDRAA